MMDTAGRQAGSEYLYVDMLQHEYVMQIGMCLLPVAVFRTEHVSMCASSARSISYWIFEQAIIPFLNGICRLVCHRYLKRFPPVTEVV
jgi:hypothetical protein